MNKSIIVSFSNGEEYSIPANFVAGKIAEYYCGKENVDYEEEYGRAFVDDYALTDWLSNNMNWSDVQHVAKIQGVKSCSFEEEWGNADKRISEKWGKQ